MKTKRTDRRDTYRLCNVSFFHDSKDETLKLASEKIMLNRKQDYSRYRSMTLHQRITARGERYPKEVYGVEAYPYCRLAQVKAGLEAHNLWLDHVAYDMSTLGLRRYYTGNW